MSENTVSWFNDVVEKKNFTILLYFRGKWWPFCRAWLKEVNDHLTDIQNSGGQVFGITAQPKGYEKKSQELIGCDFEIICDPSNAVAYELKKRGYLDLTITEVGTKGGMAYPHGMAQPGALAISRDKQVLYSWAIIPSAATLGGAKDRPSVPVMIPYIINKSKNEDAGPEPEVSTGCCACCYMLCCINMYLLCCKCYFCKMYCGCCGGDKPVESEKREPKTTEGAGSEDKNVYGTFDEKKEYLEKEITE